jgi:hypothetical protein
MQIFHFSFPNLSLRMSGGNALEGDWAQNKPCLCHKDRNTARVASVELLAQLSCVQAKEMIS